MQRANSRRFQPAYAGALARAVALMAASALTLGGCGRKAERPAPAPGASGEFAGSWNAAGSRRTLTLGDDRTGSIIDLRGTMLLTGDGRPGVGFRAEMIALVDSATGLVGRGVWTDERGDRVYSELKGEGTKERNRIAGTLVGGTGRYAGATGEFEFSWQFVIESGDGSIQGRAVGLKGRFRLEGPAPGSAMR